MIKTIAVLVFLTVICAECAPGEALGVAREKTEKMKTTGEWILYWFCIGCFLEVSAPVLHRCFPSWQSGYKGQTINIFSFRSWQNIRCYTLKIWVKTFWDMASSILKLQIIWLILSPFSVAVCIILVAIPIICWCCCVLGANKHHNLLSTEDT